LHQAGFICVTFHYTTLRGSGIQGGYPGKTLRIAAAPSGRPRYVVIPVKTLRIAERSSLASRRNEEGIL
jgi:hypothetical protein